MEMLSANFSEREFLNSPTAKSAGIVNWWRSIKHKQNAINLCQTVLQPLRDKYGPIKINSGYRVSALNRLIGGAINSQHQYGMAADITPATEDKAEKKRILEAIAEDLKDHMGGFNYYKDAEFIHVDIRGYKARW